MKRIPYRIIKPTQRNNLLSFPPVGNPSLKNGKDSGQAGMTDYIYFRNRLIRDPHILSLCLSACLVFLILSTSSAAGEKSILKGRVLNSEGKAVEGAEVFIYGSSDIRRAADFISAKTDKDGGYRMVLPAGKYWSVARFRKGGSRYGPLMPGDKHSGSPVEIDLLSGEHQMNFVVADLHEAANMSRKKTGGDYIKIKGRITDKDGLPVKMAFAIANKKKEFPVVPDYISTWTDDDGYYTLYVPRGKYHIGYAYVFPPGKNYFLNREEVFNDDENKLDIIVK